MHSERKKPRNGENDMRERVERKRLSASSDSNAYSEYKSEEIRLDIDDDTAFALQRERGIRPQSSATCTPAARHFFTTAAT